MAGLLEDRQVELERPDDTGGEIELLLDRPADLHELAQRCRALLAQKQTEADCPPGHWLG